VWFVFVAAGLVLVIVGGLYARRRLAAALVELGVGPGRVRLVRWLVAWLLFGYPLILFVAIAGGLALGRTTLPRFDGLVAAWLLGVPFVWAVLVMIQALPWLLAIDLAHLALRRRWGAARAARARAVAVVAVIAGFAVYTPIRIAAQRDELRVRRHAVGDGAGPPFRIAFVADLQQDVHTDARRAREVLSLVNAAEPDLVLAGGDWINAGPDHIQAAAASAALLRSRLGTFSVVGDHEHFAYVDRRRSVTEVEAAMTAHGVAMVDDQVRWFTHAGKRIGVVFLTYNYLSRTRPETIEALLASLRGADYTIVVTHQLDRALADRLEGRVDLVLGAHTHGGQVNPVVGLVHVPLARLETRFVDGRYQLGSTTVIVTAGIGYSLVPIRYASPSSIELIELRP